MNPWKLGTTFQNALSFAFALHQGQMRKSAEIPYFAHLMGVASIVLEYGGDETLVVAALLHDAIEDQGGESIGSVIERIFGLEVADLVRACSEDKSKPWLESKRGYVDAIAHEASGARLICAADKLHNVRTILTYHRIRGDEVWQRFKGGRDKSLWFYEAVLGALRSAANDTDPPQLAYLVDELGRALLELQNLARGRPAHSDAVKPY